MLTLSPTYNPMLAPCPQYSPSLAPNNSILHCKGSKHDNQTGSRIVTTGPALSPCPPYSPTLAPYFTHGLVPHNSVFHLKDSRSEVELQSEALHWLPALNIALHWLPQLGFSSQGLQTGSRFATPYSTLTPYTGSLHSVQGPNIDIRSLRAS